MRSRLESIGYLGEFTFSEYRILLDLVDWALEHDCWDTCEDDY